MQSKKMWVYSPPKRAKPKITESLKRQAQVAADTLVNDVLKPKNIQPPIEKARFNYVTDLYTKWYRSYLYFCATYCSPDPDAISPSFEVRFARLEYVGGNRFNLAYMRHTGQWWEIYSGLSLEEALASIRDEPHFRP